MTTSGIRKFATLLSFLAAFSSLGGAWMIAQTVAWSKMAVIYSRQSGLSDGIKNTFDGKHPCKMCHEIRKHQSQESKSDPAQLELSFETYSLPASEVEFVRYPRIQKFAIESRLGCVTFDHAPLVPPPQA